MNNDVFTTGNNPHFNMSQPIKNTVSMKGKEHLVRTAGSFLVINDCKVSDAETTVEILNMLKWEERKVHGAYGKCRYFCADVPMGINAFQGAVSIDEFVQICYENNVSMDVSINPTSEFGGSAPHQNEVVSHLVPVQKTGEVWIIVGNPKDPHGDWDWKDGVVYTWHPGPVYPMTDTLVKLKE